MMHYNHIEIEKYWQQYWESNKCFYSGVDASKPKYYVLDMFPYPSGSGLHVGHLLGYIASDIVARFKRGMGYNVLHPIGFDAFGLPAEQYAIRTGQHPSKTTKDNIERYRLQLKQVGLSFDWTREINTTKPSYYKWTQWIFIRLFNSWYNKKSNKAEPISSLVNVLSESGNKDVLACCDDNTTTITADDWHAMGEGQKQLFLLKYRLAFLAETTVNWCPALGTVLANDEVKNGFSERGGHPVELRKMRQWSLRITAYCDRLLSALDLVDWPESTKEMQKNWIGKSVGMEINFSVDGTDENIKVFTTKPYTFFGVTYIAISKDHWYVSEITKSNDNGGSVSNYLKTHNVAANNEYRLADNFDGVFTGYYATHPYTKNKLPIYIAEYVLDGYGTGAVMGVPAHDERDEAFSYKHGINSKVVIDFGCDNEGLIINSDFLNGKTITDANNEIIRRLENDKIGCAKTNYKIRDAVYSRQRYWGEPIPIYYKGYLPYLLDESELPLILPDLPDYKGIEGGLSQVDNWVTDEGYPLEQDTMPSWAGSNWYFLRYMDPNNSTALVDKEVQQYWGNVDLYMGGAEHTTGHLIYSRFITKFLYDIGSINIEEPFQKLVNQGMIQGVSYFVYRKNGTNTYVSFDLIDDYDTTKLYVENTLVNDNVLNLDLFKKAYPDASFVLNNDDKYLCSSQVEKMSKSRLNTVIPDDIVKGYGADTLRMYTMFLGPIEQSKPWNTKGIEGVYRFILKLWGLFHNEQGDLSITNDKPTEDELKVINKAIKNVHESINKYSFNTAVSSYMICVNKLRDLKCNKLYILEKLLVILFPFAPHISEELWKKTGHEQSLSYVPFSNYEDKYIHDNEIEYPIAINGKTKSKMICSLSCTKDQLEKMAIENDVISKMLIGKRIKKIIVIQCKIVNIVV